MNHRPGIRCIIERKPWLDSYDVRMGDGGPSAYHAESVGEDGYIVYRTTNDPSTDVPPFLRLSRSELEALAKAILAEERPEDATVDALKDARGVRDRLLSMLEARGIR